MNVSVIKEFTQLGYRIVGDPANKENSWGETALGLDDLAEWEEVLMSMILACHRANVDITSPDFEEAVNTAAEYGANNLYE